MAQQLITAARLFVYVNGKKFGRCTSFSWSANTAHREIGGIDSPLPYELAPTRQSVTMQMGLLRTVADGGVEGAGMISHGEDIPTSQYFTVALVERVTDTVVFRADFCSVESQSWQVAAKGVMSGDVSIRALTWSNEVSVRGSSDTPSPV